jgi:hypothetical protein
MPWQVRMSVMCCPAASMVVAASFARLSSAVTVIGATCHHSRVLLKSEREHLQLNAFSRPKSGMFIGDGREN